MFIRQKKNKSGDTTTVQIVESWRDGDKVRQTIIENIGLAKNDAEISALQRIAEVRVNQLIKVKNGGELLFDATDKIIERVTQQEQVDMFNIKKMSIQKTVHNGAEVVYGTIFDDIGFNQVLDENYSSTFKTVTTERISCPESKLSLAERITERDSIELSADKIYRMMDKIVAKEDFIKNLVRKNTENIQGKQIDVVFYDCTTLYFESTKDDEFRKFGFSKDCKHHQTQVVLALATTGKGLPVDFQIFPGNTAEVSTLITCLDNWKKMFGIHTVTFVADRGLFSVKNLYQIKNAGYDFIVACPLKKLTKEKQAEILSFFELHKKANSQEYSSLQLELSLEQRWKNPETNKYEKLEVTENLTVDYSESRALKDIHDREKLVQKIIKKIGTGESNPKNLISNNGYKKYTKVVRTGKLEIDHKKLEEDKKWDGLHGIFSSLELKPEEIRERYKHLWTIEETFRISKHNLEIRPVYHWKKDRIKAHILLCFISLTIMRTMEYRLKKQGINISHAKLNDKIAKLGYCILEDKITQKMFKLPIAVESETKTILQTLGVSLTTSVQRI